MHFKVIKNTVLFFVFLVLSCTNRPDSNSRNLGTIHQEVSNSNIQNAEVKHVVVGANQTRLYLKLIENKRVGLVANQTSVIFKTTPGLGNHGANHTHLVDSLLKHNILITKVFAPEHGFRGTADAGEHVNDGADIRTGVPIVSLYGQNKKPKSNQLSDVDLMIFDIQDVGARFYTYISTLHYVMESCAEQNIPLLVLDRPNPNSHYIDGPILEKEHRSFVGMHPVPVVHGMTIGEYAQMINGEGWLKNGIKCDLSIIPIKNYNHQTPYSLPIKPSPNLPNDTAVNLYPSLCFFEGTNISVGRGTNKQFQIIGTPFFKPKDFNYVFIPRPNNGSKSPKHEAKSCYGFDLSHQKSQGSLNLNWLIQFYKDHQNQAVHSAFFNDFFTKLAGTRQLQKQIESNYTANAIRASWEKGLEEFKERRKPYLIY